MEPIVDMFLNIVNSKKVEYWIDAINTADEDQVVLIAKMLSECELAKQELRDKGYGWTGLSLLETVKQEVPNIKD